MSRYTVTDPFGAVIGYIVVSPITWPLLCLLPIFCPPVIPLMGLGAAAIMGAMWYNAYRSGDKEELKSIRFRLLAAGAVSLVILAACWFATALGVFLYTQIGG